MGEVRLPDNYISGMRDLISKVQSYPLGFDAQEKTGKGNYIWCADWWTIEVLKCLIHTTPVYNLDPLPNRLKNNPAFVGRNEINTAADAKLKMMKTLESVKDRADTLVVCEVGRGIDILLASYIKPWARIICYDFVEAYRTILPFQFQALNIEFHALNSGDIDFSTFITEPVILIADNHRLGAKCAHDIKNNPNIKAAIICGDLKT